MVDSGDAPFATNSSRPKGGVARLISSGDEALALVKAGDYDVAMLDMSMPGLLGLDLVKRIKIGKPKLRILVLSMHAEQQYAAWSCPFQWTV